MDCNISNLLKCRMCQVLMEFNKMCFVDSWIHDENKIIFFYCLHMANSINHHYVVT